MKAKPIAQAKEIRDDGSIVQISIWELPKAVPPCAHSYKYRLYYGCAGVCFVRYDNERGKGDHKHIGEIEQAYGFTTLDALLVDFEKDVIDWS